MRCGFFTVYIVCHVNLVFILFGVCAKDANHDNDDSNNNITNNVVASTAAASAEVAAMQPPPIEILSDTNLNLIYDKLPTILIVTLFRNKAHVMPHFFTYLNRLEYPKQRISLW